MRSLVSVILSVLLSRVFLAFWGVVCVVSSIMCAYYFMKPKKM